MCIYNMWGKYPFTNIKMSFFLPFFPWKSYFHPFWLSYNTRFMEFPTDWSHVEVKKKQLEKWVIIYIKFEVSSDPYS